MSDLISRQEVSDIIKTRLYQTALNNTEYITSYDKVCEDIAENRIDTWINEAKSVEPEIKQPECVELIKYSVHGHNACKCSKCNMDLGYPYAGRFCKWCGAKMEV